MLTKTPHSIVETAESSAIPRSTKGRVREKDKDNAGETREDNDTLQHKMKNANVRGLSRCHVWSNEEVDGGLS
jgi:hypothetical protein